MKKVKVIVASLLMMGLVGCATTGMQSAGATAAATSVPTQAAVQQTQNNTVLFVQSAERARIAPVAKQPGQYTITLYGVKSRVLWFTDRPDHTAGTYPLTEFISDWTNPGPNSFELNHPNGAFMTTRVEGTDKGKDYAPIFSLANPTYNKHENSITYQATLVAGSSAPSYMYYRDVALFIDNVCMGAGCTI
jgi:hypothetical protein